MKEIEHAIITKYDLLFEYRLTKVETSLLNMDDNIKRLERAMNDNFKELKSDFRWLFGLIILFGGGLLTVMAKGLDWI